MDRRSFLRGTIVAPALGAIVLDTALKSADALGRNEEFSRVSCEKGDPGEIAYGKLVADGRLPRIFRDGVEEKNVVTADAKEGFVKRCITSERGNVAYNRASGEILYETVRGRVEIRIPEVA